MTQQLESQPEAGGTSLPKGFYRNVIRLGLENNVISIDHVIANELENSGASLPSGFSEAARIGIDQMVFVGSLVETRPEAAALGGTTEYVLSRQAMEEERHLAAIRGEKPPGKRQRKLMGKKPEPARKTSNVKYADKRNPKRRGSRGG